MSSAEQPWIYSRKVDPSEVGLTFENFVKEVHAILDRAAAGKGYAADGPDGPNPVAELTGMEHATGEIIYKALRFRSKRLPEDVVKAAAWAFLCWKHHR